MPTQYEYRILQKRRRWTMNHIYDEWFRPTGRDFQNSQSAKNILKMLREENPEDEFKLQRRPCIQEWEDVNTA